MNICVFLVVFRQFVVLFIKFCNVCSLEGMAWYIWLDLLLNELQDGMLFRLIG